MGRTQRMRRLAIFVVGGLMRLFYSHKVYGKENFPEGGGIIAANHSSFLDPPIIGISAPGIVDFLARESLFRFPLFAWLIKKLHTHPVSMGRENTGTFKKTCAFVKEGMKVVIFPEGSRSPDGQLRKGRLGVGMLVLRTQGLVIPTYIHGAYEVLPVKKKWPRLRGHTACVFGKPISFEEIDTTNRKEAQQQIADEIMARISGLRDWYLDGAKGTPP